MPPLTGMPTKPDYDPWYDAGRRYPELHIEVCPTAPADAACIPSLSMVLIGDHLGPVGRRCALAHELAHLDLEHGATTGPVLRARQEAAACRLAAVRLVPLPRLIDGLRLRPTADSGLAAELEVTGCVLACRVAQLNRVERRLVAAAVHDPDVAA